MTVVVSFNRQAWATLSAPAQLAKKAALAAFQAAKTEARSTNISISLSDDRTIAELNGKWRGLPKPTNVLAFPSSCSSHSSAEGSFLGDIILAGGVVAREARQQGKSIESHTAHLIVHGVLHLLGYDHQSADAAHAMERLEVGALKTMGIPDPYR